MHRNLGYWEMKDYGSITKYLIDKGFADPAKIAMTGFSYGGYMSAYATTYGSDIFKYGMAGGSVTDWTLYDSHYTEKFMDTPEEKIIWTIGRSTRTLAELVAMLHSFQIAEVHLHYLVLSYLVFQMIYQICFEKIRIPDLYQLQSRYHDIYLVSEYFFVLISVQAHLIYPRYIRPPF